MRFNEPATIFAIRHTMTIGSSNQQQPAAACCSNSSVSYEVHRNTHSSSSGSGSTLHVPGTYVRTIGYIGTSRYQVRPGIKIYTEYQVLSCEVTHHTSHMVPNREVGGKILRSIKFAPRKKKKGLSVRVAFRDLKRRPDEVRRRAVQAKMSVDRV